MRGLKGLALLTAVVVVGLVVRNFFAGDRRQIQRQIDALSEVASVSPAETGIERLARASRLGAFFTDDVMIRTSQSEASFVGGRQAVMALAGQTAAAYGPMSVEFADVQIGITDPSTAAVYVTATITGNRPQGGLLETREVSATFKKVNGEWLISQAEVLRPQDGQ
jgi:hypothetical protein